MRWEAVVPPAFTPALRSVFAGRSTRSGENIGVPMDSEAFAAFYERSARPLWAYLARVSGDPALADDLTQESFVRFLSAVRTPSLDDGEIASRRYLFRIATNLMRDHWRRPASSSLEEVPEEFLASQPREDAHDAQAGLMLAMAQLRPRDRQILWLAYAEGYSHREIAEITGLGSASIRLLLFRARRKMANMLREPPNISNRQTVRILPDNTQQSPRREVKS